MDGADRVTLIWADNAIQKCWLQVTVRATDHTGLAKNDVFYVGNAVGESGNSPSDTYVNALDEIGARNNPHGRTNPAPLDDLYDFNRDKYVNALDEILARNNPAGRSNALKLFTPPLEPVGGGGDGEGEGSGDVWATWTGSSRLDSSLPLDKSKLPEPLVVPLTTNSDLLRLPALLALVQASDRTATLLIGPADLFAPMAASSPTVGRMLDVRQPVSGADHLAQALAWSPDVDDDQCRVGPVKEEPSREVSGRFPWASDSRAPCASHAQPQRHRCASCRGHDRTRRHQFRFGRLHVRRNLPQLANRPR